MTPHVKVEEGKISPFAIVCGDLARAEKIASLCEEYKEIAYNREYRTFQCVYKKQPVTVTSHGIGAAGAAICFQELIDAGVKTIIRVGTCGSLQDSLNQGDHIVASAAVREDGVSKLMVPADFPAVADIEVTLALENACKAAKDSYKRGIIYTSDLFYPSVMGSNLELYSKAGVLGTEMECSILFVIAALRGVKAGAIATIDGNPLKWKEGNYDPYGDKVAKGKEKMLHIALEAILALA